MFGSKPWHLLLKWLSSGFEFTSLFSWVWFVVMMRYQDMFLHESLVLDGPSRQIHFLIFQNHLKSRENKILSVFSCSLIRPLDQENYKLLLQRRSPLQTCWRGSFSEASKPPGLWSWRLHYSLKHKTVPVLQHVTVLFELRAYDA